MPTPRADDAPERFRIALCRERWLEFAALEHETLLPVEDFALSEDPVGDELLVRRAPLPGGGRPLSAARIPRPARAALLLQAAAAAAFFGARGFPLSLEDFEHAVWDGDGGAARFWLTRTPASVRAPAAADAPSPEALRAVVRRLFAGESGRLSPEGARTLAAALEASEATWKRPEHWVASVLRAFPELAAAPAATARERCLGFASEALRSPRARALAEKARAILRGRAPRLFEAGSSPLTPGGALRLLPPADGPADAARRLRSLAKMTSRRAPSWIAVEPETWDPVSRRAFEAARHSLALARDGHLEVIVVPGALPAPDSPAEWRRAAWVPCGSLAGSVRFYEGLSAAASSHPHRARSLIRGVLGGRFWAAFAADPTGDAPLPPALFEAVPSARRRAPDAARTRPRLARSGAAHRAPARGGPDRSRAARGRELGGRIPEPAGGRVVFPRRASRGAPRGIRRPGARLARSDRGRAGDRRRAPGRGEGASRAGRPGSGRGCRAAAPVPAARGRDRGHAGPTGRGGAAGGGISPNASRSAGRRIGASPASRRRRILARGSRGLRARSSRRGRAARASPPRRRRRGDGAGPSAGVRAGGPPRGGVRRLRVRSADRPRRGGRRARRAIPFPGGARPARPPRARAGDRPFRGSDGGFGGGSRGARGAGPRSLRRAVPLRANGRMREGPRERARRRRPRPDARIFSVSPGATGSRSS